VLLRLLGGLAIVAIMGWFLYAGVRPAVAIWRGDATQVPYFGQVSLNARSYVVFLLWFVPAIGGTVLFGTIFVVSTLTGPSGRAVMKPVFIAAEALILAGLPLILLHWFVNAFAWPKSLIRTAVPGAARIHRRSAGASSPPTYRHATHRSRRRNPRHRATQRQGQLRVIHESQMH